MALNFDAYDRGRATDHALDRVNGRLKESGVVIPANLRARLDAHAQREDSAAFLLLTLPEARGDVHGGPDRSSNGNQVWAVVRRGRVVTVMFRRASQRQDPDAFYVDTVFTRPLFDSREVGL